MIVFVLYFIILIKIDERIGEYIRDRNGVCIRVKLGEVSKLILFINGCNYFKFVLNVCMCRNGVNYMERIYFY